MIRVYTRPVRVITGPVVRYKGEQVGPSEFARLPGLNLVHQGRITGIMQPGQKAGSIEYLCLEIKGQKALIANGKIKAWAMGTKTQSIAIGIIEKVEVVKG